MKRGFTLIEIIISITLIIILGTGSALFVVNTNKNNNLEKITKEILEAGSAYIKIEKDENGRVLAKEIVKGAKGVKVPVSNLVSRGYLDERIKNELYSLEGNPSSTNDYYVMFVQEGGEYCTENEIKGISSWMEKGKDVYLCDEYGTEGDPGGGGEQKTLVETILTTYSEVPIKNIITEEDYNSDSLFNGYDQVLSFSRQNGLYQRSDGTHYYRGNVGNNYVAIFGQLFRILSFDMEKIRLIKENAISDVYLDYSKSLNTNFTESLIYDATLSYLNDFKTGCYSLSNDMDKCWSMFIKGKFCDGQVETEWGTNSNNRVIKQSDCSEDLIDLDVGIINAEEAIFAGVSPYITTRTCHPLYNFSDRDGLCDSYSVGNSWLTSGSSLITMNTYLLTASYPIRNRHLVIPNELNHIKNTTTDATIIGIFTSFWSDYYNNNEVKEKVSTMIRPVIVLNNSYTKVEGKGTVDSPYTLIFE